MHPSTALARVLVDELVRGGVTDVVLAPGSRNAPLSMALHDADLVGRLRLHVRIDERTAGFLAVGLARATGRPAVVVTTSGTAVANLHPALLEAHHGQVPVIVVTADRPAALRDVGANQVIDQRSTFGPILNLFHEFATPVRATGQVAGWRAMVSRALSAAAGFGGVPGPAQLNMPLAEPLMPEPVEAGAVDPDWVEPLGGRDGPWTTIRGSASSVAVPAVQPGERVLFLADFTHPWARRLADAGQLVISEAGGAAGRNVLAGGLHLLAVTGFLDAARPERVIVLGRPTLYRPVGRLLADPKLVVDVVAAPQGYADTAGTARFVAPAMPDVTELPDDEWSEQWRAADRAAVAAVGAELGGGVGIEHSPRLARELVATLPDGATLVVGSSQPPRDIGLSAVPRDGLTLLANRGVAGIDGTISTACGVALAVEGPTVALLGDLTFLHDTTGLMIGPHEPRPDLTIVVSSNDGGGIFATLEPGDPAHAAAFERVFATPHGVRIQDLARACGVPHRRVTSAAELAAAIGDPGGLCVVEVPTNRTGLRGLLTRISSAVRSAVTAG